MPRELAEAFAEKYPKGFNDYLPDLTKYTKPDGTPFYAVLIELPEDIYLVKIKVKIDDADDIKNWLEGEEEAENDVFVLCWLNRTTEFICGLPQSFLHRNLLLRCRCGSCHIKILPVYLSNLFYKKSCTKNRTQFLSVRTASHISPMSQFK